MTDLLKQLEAAAEAYEACASANTDNQTRNADRVFRAACDNLDFPALLDLLRRQQAVIEKLPKTADGVPIVSHTDSVWAPWGQECWVATATHASYYPASRPKGPADLIPVSACYSTPAAAEAANREGK